MGKWLLLRAVSHTQAHPWTRHRESIGRIVRPQARQRQITFASAMERMRLTRYTFVIYFRMQPTGLILSPMVLRPAWLTIEVFTHHTYTSTITTKHTFSTFTTFSFSSFPFIVGRDTRESINTQYLPCFPRMLPLVYPSSGHCEESIATCTKTWPQASAKSTRVSKSYSRLRNRATRLSMSSLI